MNDPFEMAVASYDVAQWETLEQQRIAAQVLDDLRHHAASIARKRASDKMETK